MHLCMHTYIHIIHTHEHTHTRVVLRRALPCDHASYITHHTYAHTCMHTHTDPVQDGRYFVALSLAIIHHTACIIHTHVHACIHTRARCKTGGTSSRCLLRRLRRSGGFCISRERSPSSQGLHTPRIIHHTSYIIHHTSYITHRAFGVMMYDAWRISRERSPSSQGLHT